jgi:hypothetical protein
VHQRDLTFRLLRAVMPIRPDGHSLALVAQVRSASWSTTWPAGQTLLAAGMHEKHSVVSTVSSTGFVTFGSDNMAPQHGEPAPVSQQH